MEEGTAEDTEEGTGTAVGTVRMGTMISTTSTPEDQEKWMVSTLYTLHILYSSMRLKAWSSSTISFTRYIV